MKPSIYGLMFLWNKRRIVTKIFENPEATAEYLKNEDIESKGEDFIRGDYTEDDILEGIEEYVHDNGTDIPVESE